METTWTSRPSLQIHTRMLDQHKSYKELLCYYLDKRKDINLVLALHFIFRNFGYESKSQFLKLTNYLHKEKSYYNGHIKFRTKCRFYQVFPNHLEFITKNVKKNYMFSNNMWLKFATLRLQRKSKLPKNYDLE